MKFTGCFQLKHYDAHHNLLLETQAKNSFFVEGLEAMWRRILRRDLNATYFGLIRGGDSFEEINFDTDTIGTHPGWEESDAEGSSRPTLNSLNFFTYESAGGIANFNNYTQEIRPKTFDILNRDVLTGLFLTSARFVNGTTQSGGIIQGHIYCAALLDDEIIVRPGDSMSLAYTLQGSSPQDGPA